jgi:hypothetical protein
MPQMLRGIGMGATIGASSLIFPPPVCGSGTRSLGGTKLCVVTKSP